MFRALWLQRQVYESFTATLHRVLAAGAPGEGSVLR
jgi:hypothetical protein